MITPSETHIVCGIRITIFTAVVITMNWATKAVYPSLTPSHRRASAANRVSLPKRGATKPVKLWLKPASSHAVEISLGYWDLGSDVEPFLFKRLAKEIARSSANEFFCSYANFTPPFSTQYCYLFNRSTKTIVSGSRDVNDHKESPPIEVYHKVTDAKIRLIVQKGTAHVADLLLFGCSKSRVR